MTFPRYDEYKDSGVEWLGEVPAHWQTLRIKTLFEICKRIVGEDGFDVLSVTQKGVRVKDIHSGDGQLSMDYSKYQLVEVGDFAMNHMDLLTGYVDVSPSLGVTSPDYRVFRQRTPREHLDRYFLYLFQNAYKRRIFFPYGQGSSQLGRWRLPTDEFNTFRLPCPSRDEQATIAAFLDHETAKIDELVAEQQNLIALLKEKRQALISHAVTKGLDPNVPMKDSGVEWLGDVPVHWERVQLGKVCRQVSDGPHFSPSYVEDGVLFLSARNFSAARWFLDDAKYVSEADYEEFCKRVVPEKGDVLYSKGGTTGVARVVDLNERFQVWVHVAVLKLQLAVINPNFLAYSLNSHACYEQSQLLTRGATNQDLGLGRMVKIWFALPTIQEQSLIASWLDAETTKTDALITEAESAIMLLQERRTALISAAVTGKIDVRNRVSRKEVAAA